MKTITIVLTTILIYAYVAGWAQTSRLTIEPAIGIHTNFGTDVVISNLVQYNQSKNLSFGSYSAYNINNATQRNFNLIKTDYNFSLNQKFGIGLTFTAKKFINTFFLMGGAKYTSFKETLNNPNLDRVSTSVKSMTADYGVMYSVKRSKGRYYLTTRFYLPLSPWLNRGAKIDYLQGTLRDISLEVGVGIKIK